jgi:mono/diheme cytochrome c family protein
MTGLVALSTPATIALVAAALIGVAFVAGLIAAAVRRRAARGPDIPPGMRPGPADEVLERRNLDRTMGWGVLFVIIMALWLPALWLREPSANVDDAFELISRSEERGSQWFQLAGEENPTGFGCARCHGEQAEGGTVAYTTPDGETIPDYPVPRLTDVCGGPTTGHPLISPENAVEDIRATIEQGREGTPMPSWSIRYAGPMNDQQIQDLINYLLSIQTVQGEQNFCVNPSTGGEGPAPAPTASPSPSPGGGDQGGGGGQGGGS